MSYSLYIFSSKKLEARFHGAIPESHLEGFYAWMGSDVTFSGIQEAPAGLPIASVLK